MDSAKPIISIVLIGVIALVGLLVVGSLAGVAVDFGIEDDVKEIDSPQTGQQYNFDLDEPDTFEVKATHEVAIDPQADGYVSLAESGEFETGGWSIMVTAGLNASETATYNIFSYDDESILIEYDAGQYRAHYYNGTQSATANVTAADPTTLTPIGVSWNNTAEELTIAADNSSDTGGLTATNPSRSLALDWDGPIDELRVFNESKNVSASPYQSDPIRPLSGDQTTRLMFDEGDGDSATNYYGTDATLQGTVWTDGVANPDLVAGEDYEATTGPTSVTFLAGGYFDGAPVAYVELEKLGPLAATIDGIVSGFGSAFGLIPIIMLVILSSVVISVVQRFRM